MDLFFDTDPPSYGRADGAGGRYPLASTNRAETLENKTLVAPTISGAPAFSGDPTFAGNPVFSGNPNFTGDPKGVVVTKVVPFVEQAGTTLTGTVPLPAGSHLLNIQIVVTVLFGGTSASLDVGDDDDPDGWFATVNLKATDLLVGEVLDISNAENWGATQGAYLDATTGRKGSVAASNSGIYYGAANNVIGVVTMGTPSTTGRAFMIVSYSVPEIIAAVVA